MQEPLASMHHNTKYKTMKWNIKHIVKKLIKKNKVFIFFKSPGNLKKVSLKNMKRSSHSITKAQWSFTIFLQQIVSIIDQLLDIFVWSLDQRWTLSVINLVVSDFKPLDGHHWGLESLLSLRAVINDVADGLLGATLTQILEQIWLAGHEATRNTFKQKIR